MKRLACLALSSILVSAGAARAAEEGSLKSGDYVAIIGDSITEQKQYSVFMEDYLLMCKPVTDVKTTQFGWGGETAPGFAGRMKNDMLRFPATVATTCFGMNDGGYSPMDDAKAKRYLDGQKSVVEQLKKGGVRFIVLGSPGCVDLNTFRNHTREAAEMYNKTLDAEREIDVKLAKDEGIAFADVFTPMHDVMVKAEAKYGKDYHVGGADGVHPDQNGHLVMAYAFLKGLGCKGDIGTITVDLAGNKATGSDGHKVLGVNNGEVEVESSRYPFCFPNTGALNVPNSTRGVLEFFPFNEELNRFKLVVTNTGGKQVKVTFGKGSKTYSSEELAKGVNLAADFLDNPFVEPFMKVHGVIQQQQSFETPLVKEYIHFAPDYIAFDPEVKDPMEKVLTKAIAKDGELQKASTAAVAPVKYTIKIEAEK